MQKIQAGYEQGGAHMLAADHPKCKGKDPEFGLNHSTSLPAGAFVQPEQLEPIFAVYETSPKSAVVRGSATELTDMRSLSSAKT